MAKTKDRDVYNPEENTTDNELPEVIEKILEDQKAELETPDLAKAIDKNGLFSEDTARTKLYYAIPDVRKRAAVEVYKEKGGTPGSDTWKWRIDRSE